ncbi:hypothetical protein DSCA_49080 [Desulfosarcina alkanivorans]|uniref:Phage capsid-like C-terminal domain-containing protein n=1 Tax=Desulfosarcina alkanivorans TaxID=571177 RepID=A0A5K7YQH8_9BACT|nr:phage major capsid protein [Desulfosarcina alkanivorans]BBO70978.1 hypothetical protein DSCA_49080 [Desulfosarcina alkanivorans]
MKIQNEVADSFIGMSDQDKARYSFSRAVNAAIFGAKDQDFIKAAGFELEASAAAAKHQPNYQGGVIIPWDMMGHRDVTPFNTRTLTAGTATDGAELVADNLLAGSFIDVLRNRCVCMSLGAVKLDGLVGDVLIPRKTSGAVAGWISTEGGNAGNSEAQFDQISMKPKTAAAYTEISRNLRLQSTPAADMIIKDDLTGALAVLIDKAAFYGTGADGQPKGISLQTGINTPTDFAAAVPTWAEVVAMESAVAVDNALQGTTGYVLEPAMAGSLKVTEKIAATGEFIYDGGKSLNGHKVAITSQITAGDMFFGNFSDLIIGFWGGLEILVDPYTHSLSGTVRIVAHQSIDVAVRHPVSFAFNNDGS